MDTTVLLTILNVFLVCLSTLSAYWAYRELKRDTYMQFYEIVARHHTQDVTNLRREVMTKLPSVAESALQQNKSLLETNPELQLKTSALANYYEGLGHFSKADGAFSQMKLTTLCWKCSITL